LAIERHEVQAAMRSGLDQGSTRRIFGHRGNVYRSASVSTRM